MATDWQVMYSCSDKSTRNRLSVHRYIDTAEAYGNQPQIKLALSASEVKREELFITSKVFHGHLRTEEVVKSCEQTLRELGTEYLDLYLIHWPNSTVPIAETLNAMQMLVEQGKIRAIGVSNFTIKHLKQVLTIDIQIVNNQVEYHPSLNQEELRAFCEKYNILVTAYSPLAQGQDLKLSIIQELAKKYSRSSSQIVLNWLISKGLNAIPRASNADHIADNFKALEWEMERTDISAIDAIGGDNRLVKPWFNEFGR